MNVTIYFDGACEPRNPGGVATGGWIILGDGDEPLDGGCCEFCRGPSATNNVAEYRALESALQKISESGLPVDRLMIHGDSKLVINQLLGSWRCNKEHLAELRDRCKEWITKINPKRLELAWIPREQNEEADALSRKAYEEATGKQFPVRAR
jgi:ribonuclease HI